MRVGTPFVHFVHFVVRDQSELCFVTAYARTFRSFRYSLLVLLSLCRELIMPLLEEPAVLNYSLGDEKNELNEMTARPKGRSKRRPMGHAQSEKWITWAEYSSGQSSRIFAGAAAVRKSSAGKQLNLESLPKSVTSFQRAFFERLRLLPATSEQELLRQAHTQGIPNECATAHWKARRCSEVLLTSKPQQIRKLLHEGEEVS